MSPADRRQFLTGAGVAAVACCGLAGCSRAAEPAGQGTTSGVPSTTGSATGSGPGSAADTGAVPTGPTVPKGEVPVGGGKILNAEKVVVVQPENGTFKAYTSICTHQGCDVTRVENNEIHCDCHGSVFSAMDGSVTTGPAESPLGSRNVTVSGDDVVVEA